MQMVVCDRSSPWKRAVETLLTRKKQLLEYITKKQILTNRWKLEERERQDFEKTLGWSKFSKEDTTGVELGEIRQRTVTGLTLQELLPQGEYPHPGITQAETNPHLQVTYSRSTVHTLYTTDTNGRTTSPENAFCNTQVAEAPCTTFNCLVPALLQSGTGEPRHDIPLYSLPIRLTVVKIESVSSPYVVYYKSKARAKDSI
jgi:hypothetical protein